MNSLATKYLDDLSVDRTDPVYLAVEKLEMILQQSADAVWEEAVPAEMMQMFSDEQWPNLLFQFQPSMWVFEIDFALIEFRQAVEKGIRPDLPQRQESRHWLVFCDQDGQLLRAMDQLEYQAISLANRGMEFAAIARELWPDIAAEQQQSQLTEILLVWLGEGLVIDAGVALPEDAEFEQKKSKVPG